jgi:hypothetical protein
MEEIKSI